ncbi:glycerophosphodiester phosphodiesterase [Serratia sp. DD3]|uniref:glycerophosphodiester phosphodiesterase n=1 Tax=Serratia sp. DD3 TaxID=1410619 RepID=UPI0003C525AE|nr:glycerophosphodiester phosphodiesterase [Serratia sp. DD3]KEY58860.1 glycerophosphoryl diester phosphodiesterase [Serratia sp. DD3]
MEMKRHRRWLCATALMLSLAGCDNGSSNNSSSDNSNNNKTEDKHLFFQSRAFDLEAHRGGLGLVSESTIESFSHALEMGVTTLELDVHITGDGVAVVGHDRKISDKKCLDTGPAFPNDPMYPYVGRYIKDLTLAQVKTLDCGSLQLAAYPNQLQVPGAKMPTLREVFDLVKLYKASNVMLSVETKVEAGAPWETAPRDVYVQTVVDEIHQSGLINQVVIQSFDWGALMKVREIEPKLPIVALTNGQQFLQAGMPGPSPWLGGIDIDDFNGDLVAGAKSFGADAISPVHGDPQNGHYGDNGYVPYTTEDLVKRAHDAGIKVIPWTVSDVQTMNYLMDIGVDGLITDLPDLLRQVMEQRGLPLPLPAPVPAPQG